MMGGGGVFETMSQLSLIRLRSKKHGGPLV